MRVARSSRARAGCVTGCLIRLMAIVLLAGLAALIVFTIALVRSDRLSPELVGGLSGASTTQRMASGAVQAVRPTGERPGGLLVVTTRENTSGPALSFLAGEPLEVHWDSDTLNEDAARIPPALAAETVYLSDGARLVALDLSNGERRWSADLDAAIAPGCASCIQPLDGAVAVLTEDQTLHALTADDGEPLWQVALNTLPRELFLIDGSPAVIATLPENENSALIIFDSQTGTERVRIAPRCETGGAAESLTPGSPVLYDVEENALYFLFGFEQHGCAQRWDAATGQMVWTTSVPLKTSGWPRTWAMTGPLLSRDAIYLAGAEGASILAISTADGTLSTLFRGDAFMLEPWALDANTLLAHAERPDSLESEELWGIDTSSGEALWRYTITRDNSSWTAQAATDGFVVIQLLGEPPRLQVALLDARTGAARRLRTLPLDSVAWTGTTWTDDTGWLTIGALYAIDLRNGIPSRVWPAP